jgi:hypothetical protein
LSLMVTLAVAAPECVGAKTTDSVQFAPTAMLFPQLFVRANSAASVPVTLTLPIVRAAVPEFESVSEAAGLLDPIIWLPKDTLLGFRVRAGTDAAASTTDTC